MDSSARMESASELHVLEASFPTKTEPALAQTGLSGMENVRPYTSSYGNFLSKSTNATKTTFASI